MRTLVFLVVVLSLWLVSLSAQTPTITGMEPGNKEKFAEDLALEAVPAQEELYVLGELYTHATLLGGPRLTLLSGQMGFDSPFGGRTGSKLDLQKDLFMGDDALGAFFGIDVQHSYFHINLSYGYSQNKSQGNLEREVVISDTLFQKGAKIQTDMENHWFNASIGYTLLAKSWGGVGVQLGLDYIYVRFISRVEGFPADDPTNPFVSVDLSKNIFVPTPTIGGYVDVVPFTNCVVRCDINFIHYDIATRRLTTVTLGLEPRYYLTATQEYYAYFKFKYEYFAYDFATTQVDAYWEWHSFLFLFGAGIKF
jgi:hypothetical protein